MEGISFSVCPLQEVTRMIMHAELILARNISLKAKFTEELLEHADAREELEKFVSAVLQTAEVEVRGGPMGPAGSVIYKLFQAAQRVSLNRTSEKRFN